VEIDFTLDTLEKIKKGELPATLETLKPILDPNGVTNGVMKADPQKCSGCGLCIQNCPFRCWEMGENHLPRMKKTYICFSCFNCKIACPRNAVLTIRTFRVKDGFFDTDFPAFKMPEKPKDASGNPDEWNEVEWIVMNRRSVRNFKKTPVPEPLLRRILEAGRFAPSGGNSQSWKFAVVTDPDFIIHMETLCRKNISETYQSLQDNKAVLELVKFVPLVLFDPRVKYGLNCVSKKELPVFLNAPAVILLASQPKLSDPEMHVGIAGQNMTLVAKSLGLGSCWSGFSRGVNAYPEIMHKLGFDPPWVVHSSICVGYPKFKQEGIVARHSRPVNWIRPGSEDPQIET